MIDEITVTLGEVLETNHWFAFCQKYGWDEMSVSEGVDPDSEQIIDMEDAVQWGLSAPTRG